VSRLPPARRGPAHPPVPAPHVDAYLAGAMVGAAVVVGWVWLAGELAGWSSTGRWPPVPLAAAPSVASRLCRHLADPRSAWPPRVMPSLPGRWWFYGWGAALALPALAAARCWSGRRRRRSRRGARWARPAELHRLRLPRRAAGAGRRLVLGRSSAGGMRVAVEERHSVLVIGPTQSGKTSGLAIPALLEWKGPAVATSVKDDLAATTLAWRSTLGPCSVFDPTGGSGVAAVSSWSPLSGCDGWSEAQRMAGWLVESTPGRRGMADAAFWYTAAAKQLAPLLLAAERAGLGMAEVVGWTDSDELGEPLRILETCGETDAALALAACAGRDERIRSSVGTTLETVLAPFEDPVVAASTARSDIDLAGVLEGNGTLYLCGPSHEQSRVQGLFAALVSTVVSEAYRRVARSGRPLDPPLLIVLDEAANIAPVRDLDTLASTGAGLGIQLVTVCQDLAQLAARYDNERARTIANNHRAKLLLSGVSDLATLDLVSGLAGEEAALEESTSHDLRDGRRTRSVSTVHRRLAPSDELRRIPPGEGVLVYGHLPPARILLRPWYSDRKLRRRAAAGAGQVYDRRALLARLGATRGGSPGIFG